MALLTGNFCLIVTRIEGQMKNSQELRFVLEFLSLLSNCYLRSVCDNLLCNDERLFLNKRYKIKMHGLQHFITSPFTIITNKFTELTKFQVKYLNNKYFISSANELIKK